MLLHVLNWPLEHKVMIVIEPITPSACRVAAKQHQGTSIVTTPLMIQSNYNSLKMKVTHQHSSSALQIVSSSYNLLDTDRWCLKARALLTAEPTKRNNNKILDRRYTGERKWVCFRPLFTPCQQLFLSWIPLSRV